MMKRMKTGARSGRAVNESVGAACLPAFSPHPGAAHAEAGLLGGGRQTDCRDLFHQANPTQTG